MSGSMAGARRAAVLAAMLPELRPIVRALGLRPWPPGGERAYRGRAGDREVFAAVTSMGTRAAADATRRLLDAARVDHLLVVGICGGIDPRLELGELIVPERVVDEASGIEHRPVRLGETPARGALLTTDVLHDRREAVAELHRRGFVAVDMETAAIGAACEARGIPWSVLRAVSDRAGDPQLDGAILGLSRPDGSPAPAAILRFLLTRPHRIPKLVRLGTGMRRAVRSSTSAALAALEAAG